VRRDGIGEVDERRGKGKGKGKMEWNFIKTYWYHMQFFIQNNF